MIFWVILNIVLLLEQPQNLQMMKASQVGLADSSIFSETQQGFDRNIKDF